MPTIPQRAFVPYTALATEAAFTDDAMQVTLADGRVLSVPLVWFPRLLRATPQERANVAIGAGGRGLHWPDLDEDISVVGLLAGSDERFA